jgi:hypothetical protein
LMSFGAPPGHSTASVNISPKSQHTLTNQVR